MKRTLVLIVALLCALASPVFAQTGTQVRTQSLVILQQPQVAGIAATTLTRNTVTGLIACKALDVLINITATGTATGTLQIFLEDSADGGTTWDDMVASNTFAFGASVINQRFYVNGFIASTATSGSATAIETLAAGTTRQGPFADRIRVREKVSGPSGSPVGPTYTITAVCKP